MMVSRMEQWLKKKKGMSSKKRQWAQKKKGNELKKTFFQEKKNNDEKATHIFLEVLFKTNLRVFKLTEWVEKTPKNGLLHKNLDFDLGMLQKHLGYEKTCIFHELFHELKIKQIA